MDKKSYNIDNLYGRGMFKFEIVNIIMYYILLFIKIKYK